MSDLTAMGLLKVGTSPDDWCRQSTLAATVGVVAQIARRPLVTQNALAARSWLGEPASVAIVWIASVPSSRVHGRRARFLYFLPVAMNPLGCYRLLA